MRRDKAFFTDRERVEALAQALTTPLRTVTVQPDEEHQAFALAIEDRSGGYPRHHRVDQDFVTTGEFRTLSTSYQDVKDIRGPMIVKTTAAAPVEDIEAIEGGTASANETAIGGAPLDEATKLAAEPKELDAVGGSAPGEGRKGRRRPHRVARRAGRVLHRGGQEGRGDQPLQGPRRDEPGHALGNDDEAGDAHARAGPRRGSTWKRT